MRSIAGYNMFPYKIQAQIWREMPQHRNFGTEIPLHEIISVRTLTTELYFIKGASHNFLSTVFNKTVAHVNKIQAHRIFVSNGIASSNRKKKQMYHREQNKYYPPPHQSCLLAHFYFSNCQICYCGQISLQSAAVFLTIWHLGGNIYFAGDGTYIRGMRVTTFDSQFRKYTNCTCQDSN